MEGDELRVVTIGGGTGSHAILTGLKRHAVDISAVVAMTDRGGSSGRLRDDFGHLPPGDVRQCLAALAPEDHDSLLLRQLFSFRFAGGDGLEGHSFGNLFITALVEITGSIDKAIDEAARILNTKGRVIPVTLGKAELCGRLADGSVIIGEDQLDVRTEKPEVPIDYVYLDPHAFVNPAAAQAIMEADGVVLGPGDLYTSVAANLVVDGIPKALSESSAKKIFVMNLVTKRGESEGFKASDFIHMILEYLGSDDALDAVLIDSSDVPARVLRRYESEGSELVQADLDECRRLVPKVLLLPLAHISTYLRHDPDRLAKAVLDLIGDSSASPQ